MNVKIRNRIVFALVCALIFVFCATATIVLCQADSNDFNSGFIAPAFTTIEVDGETSSKNVLVDNGARKQVDIAVPTNAQSGYTICVEADSNVEVQLVDSNGDSIDLLWDEAIQAYVYDTATAERESIGNYSVVINGSGTKLNEETKEVVSIVVKQNKLEQNP